MTDCGQWGVSGSGQGPRGACDALRCPPPPLWPPRTGEVAERPEGCVGRTLVGLLVCSAAWLILLREDVEKSRPRRWKSCRLVPPVLSPSWLRGAGLAPDLRVHPVVNLDAEPHRRGGRAGGAHLNVQPGPGPRRGTDDVSSCRAPREPRVPSLRSFAAAQGDSPLRGLRDIRLPSAGAFGQRCRCPRLGGNPALPRSVTSPLASPMAAHAGAEAAEPSGVGAAAERSFLK